MPLPLSLSLVLSTGPDLVGTEGITFFPFSFFSSGSPGLFLGGLAALLLLPEPASFPNREKTKLIDSSYIKIEISALV